MSPSAAQPRPSGVSSKPVGPSGRRGKRSDVMTIATTLSASWLSRRGRDLGVLNPQVDVALAYGNQPFDGVATRDADGGAHLGRTRLADEQVVLESAADVRPTQSAIDDIRRHRRVALKRNQG